MIIFPASLDIFDIRQHYVRILYISLPNDKILNVTKLKALADDKLNVAKTISLFINGKH